MAEKIVNHTWSIHYISSFVIPLPWCRLQENATTALRQSKQATGANKCTDIEGNYVKVSWINLSSKSPVKTEESSEENERTKRTADEIASQSHAEHLHVEVRVQEEWSAELLFCFVSKTDQRIMGFDFCLVRGCKTYQAIWHWLETTTGCVVGKQPLHFNSSELALTATLWTTRDYQWRKENADGIAKPLALTFSVPATINGLETLSLSIPPASLLQLCTNIEKEHPKKRPRREFAADEDVEQNQDDASVTALPILKAMQCYIREAFRINIESFLLTKISCGVASLVRDGRCKPQNTELLPSVLEGIRTTVQSHAVQVATLD